MNTLDDPFFRAPDPDGKVRYTKDEILFIAREIESGLTDPNSQLLHRAVIVFLEEALV